MEEAEHNLIAVGSLVLQCVHAGNGSDNRMLFHLPLPLVSYLTIQHPCEVGT